MNIAVDLLERPAPERRALVELARDGSRREWTFGQIARDAALLAGTLRAHGVGRGDVVMTLIGNRPEWALAMLATLRIGAIVFPCNEQLRSSDLRLRLETTRPALVVADERNRAELETARPACPVLTVPGAGLLASEPAPPVELSANDPALIVFTSGSTGEPKAVLHGQRYFAGQHVQAHAWLGAHPDELVWCTASSGWSKSARNAFVAPWLCGAAAVLHDGRFDPAERLEILARERVAVLCMAPTEYRVIAKRTTLGALPDLRGAVAAGEPLNPGIIDFWREAAGVAVRDGYGQTETGQTTAIPPDAPARPGSMGLPLPGIDAWVDESELVLDPSSVPTFFLGYLSGEPAPPGPWRTGDRVTRDEDGYLYFEGRADDIIISAGYRIGPFEVESALVRHGAVAEAAAVAAPDDERGAVVRAIVVLRSGHEPSDALARELQDHVKRETAPYKYPRIVDFATELPKTSSGKIRRAALRDALS